MKAPILLNVHVEDGIHLDLKEIALIVVKNVMNVKCIENLFCLLITYHLYHT